MLRPGELRVRVHCGRQEDRVSWGTGRSQVIVSLGRDVLKVSDISGCHLHIIRVNCIVHDHTTIKMLLKIN